MAIRPVDLQATILQSTQTASVQRQAEVASQTAASLNNAQFAAKVEERSETVQETERQRGNRVEEKKEPDQQQARGRRQQARTPGQPFESIEENVLTEGAASADHLIDFTA